MAATELRGRTMPWTRRQVWLLLTLTLLGLALRLLALSSEGFADDEVHKWLAANRYVAGDFGGDDVEHPMLMKWLIAACLLVGRRVGWAPETITRLPNALAGGVSVLAVALLGRRLFGRTAALWAAALASVCVTLVGYQRIAKEDTLLGLFVMLVCWCTGEAKAAADDGRTADQRRWEWLAAAALAGMLASKYFVSLAPIPLVFYAWVHRSGTSWRVPPARWGRLIGVALLMWASINWTPFFPSTWKYAASYITGRQTVQGNLFFMGRIYPNLVEYGVHGMPPWFYVVFGAVKLAPLTLAFALGGLAIAIGQRRPAHRLILAWIGLWFVVHSLIGSKWGRFFTSVLPGLLLLAAHAATVSLARVRPWLGATRTALASVALAVALVGGEAWAALTHAPHYRLYVSPLGGGDRNVSWYFPHCDYYDAGFREAVVHVAARAERGAEVSSEVDWLSRLYADRAGRADLRHTLLRRTQACRADRVCYVIVQTGRLYFQNEDAVRALAARLPWYTVQLRGESVVKVYRLAPGEAPFPATTSPLGE